MTATARIAAATTLACALCSFDVRADDLASLRAELEAQAAAAPAVAAAAAPAPSGHAAGTGTAFNPAMSVILAGSYAHLSQDYFESAAQVQFKLVEREQIAGLHRWLYLFRRR